MYDVALSKQPQRALGRFGGEHSRKEPFKIRKGIEKVGEGMEENMNAINIVCREDSLGKNMIVKSIERTMNLLSEIDKKWGRRNKRIKVSFSKEKNIEEEVLGMEKRTRSHKENIFKNSNEKVIGGMPLRKIQNN